MTAKKEKQLVFLRRNAGDARGETPKALTEREARELLAVVFKQPDRAIARLKRGDTIETRYATYVARRA